MASFVAGCCNPTSASDEFEFIRQYLEQLREFGVTGYSDASAWVDYKMSLGALVILGVSSCASPKHPSSDRAAHLINICMAADRHNIIDGTCSHTLNVVYRATSWLLNRMLAVEQYTILQLSSLSSSLS